MRLFGAPEPSLPIGRKAGAILFPTLRIPRSSLMVHSHVLGVSGAGKSRFVARFALELMRSGIGVTLLDPHGDLAKLVMSTLAASDPQLLEQTIYLDLPEAERRRRYLPFNVLKQPFGAHALASNVREAFHRAWPALGFGAAPMFDTLIQDSVKTLSEQGYPLTSLYRFITDKGFRDRLLEHEPDIDIVSFWHEQFDRLAERDRIDQAGSALRRAHLLTFSPVLKYNLGQDELAVDLQRVMNQGQHLIVNLALPDGEAKRLLGCLLTVAAEQAAISRWDPRTRRAHVLILDEFAEFSAQSEEALTTMLSQTRKFGLFVLMSHQTWSQASERLRGAMQNVGLEVAFRLGREDAQRTALSLARVDPEAIKHEADNTKIHPLFSPLQEQWERHVQAIQDLPNRHAITRLPDGLVQEIVSLDMPDPKIDELSLRAIEEAYLSTYFRPEAEVLAQLEARRAPISQQPQVVRKRRLY